MNEWSPHAGVQTAFLACGAFEACAGGTVGAGKTSSLLAGPLRYVHRDGFAGLILRRNYTELTKADGLIERAWNFYPRVGGQAHNGGLSWTWPGGGRVDLAGMDRAEDRFKFDGSAYQFVAFDELQTFEEIQYTYLPSRMRQNDRIMATGEPIPLRIRSSATPGGIGHDWVVDRFSPWIRAGDPEYHGITIEDGAWLWYRHDPDVDAQVICEEGHPDAQSRVFFATEMLTEYVGDDYMRGLDSLDPLTRRQRKFGDWLAKPGVGMLFRREWFTRELGTMVLERPKTEDVLAYVRGWDLAATEQKPGKEPAATASVRMALLANRKKVIVDAFEFYGRPAEVEKRILECSVADDQVGVKTLVSLPQDPGQAGVAQRESFARLLEGRWWECTPESGDKVDRAKPLSSDAEQGNIILVRDEWTELFIKRAVNFPIARLKDVIDAATRAHRKLAAFGRTAGSTASGGAAKQVSMHRKVGGF